MTYGKQQLQQLKGLLEGLGVNCSDADLEKAALAITRFVFAKEVAAGLKLIDKKDNDERFNTE